MTNDKELCERQRYERILQENLYGFYRIDSIKSLDIDISSLKRFEKSATEFISNDDIWVDVDYR